MLALAGMVCFLAGLAGAPSAFDGTAWAAAPGSAIQTNDRLTSDEPEPSLTDQELERWREQRQERRRARQAAALERQRSVRQDTPPKPAAPAATAPPAPLRGIDVAFMLDPRLTSGLYMGERWVSPPTYTRVQEGTSLTVAARAAGRDARGTPINISPTWIPADPEMVTVSPGQGNAVQITVHRAGQSRLQVTSQEVSKYLSIKAVARNNGLQVEISQ